MHSSPIPPRGRNISMRRGGQCVESIAPRHAKRDGERRNEVGPLTGGA